MIRGRLFERRSGHFAAPEMHALMRKARQAETAFAHQQLAFVARTSESGITAKMRELLSEIAPGLKRIAILFNPDTAPGGGAYYLRDFEAAAQSSR
jgi:hypothetical protein